MTDTKERTVTDIINDALKAIGEKAKAQEKTESTAYKMGSVSDTMEAIMKGDKGSPLTIKQIMDASIGIGSIVHGAETRVSRKELLEDTEYLRGLCDGMYLLADALKLDPTTKVVSPAIKSTFQLCACEAQRNTSPEYATCAMVSVLGDALKAALEKASKS